MSAIAQPRRRSVAASRLRPLSRQPDDRLVALCRAGDERAFEVLARRHAHELQVYAGRLLGALGCAEDVLQHALMNAWVALSDRDVAVANPRAWLYGIVHNSAVTVLRRARLDTLALNDALDVPSSDTDPDVDLLVGEILAGLAAMPEPQRRALIMTAVAGSTHEEAAAALGVSDGAVRGMVYRARVALRQAAAAVLPAPLWSWASRLAQRRAPLPVVPTDAATAVTSASAGALAIVVKGSAIVAAVGALAGTGGALLPGAGERPHPQHQPAHPAAVRHLAAPRRPRAAGAPPTPALASVQPLAGSAEAHHRVSVTAAQGRSGHSAERGSDNGSSSRGRGNGDPRKSPSRSGETSGSAGDTSGKRDVTSGTGTGPSGRHGGAAGGRSDDGSPSAGGSPSSSDPGSGEGSGPSAGGPDAAAAGSSTSPRTPAVSGDSDSSDTSGSAGSSGSAGGDDSGSGS